jgi:hypothetical protein
MLLRANTSPLSSISPQIAIEANTNCAINVAETENDTMKTSLCVSAEREKKFFALRLYVNYNIIARYDFTSRELLFLCLISIKTKLFFRLKPLSGKMMKRSTIN